MERLESPKRNDPSAIGYGSIGLQIDGSLLRNILDITMMSESFNLALQDTINCICDSTDWDVGHAYVKDVYGKNELVSTSIWHLNDEERHSSFRDATEKLMRFGEGFGLPGEVLASGEPAWCENLQNDPNSPRYKLCKDMAVKGAFAFPIKDGDTTIAVLEFFSTDEIIIDEAFSTQMLDIGGVVGILLAKKHAEKSLLEQKYAIDQSALVVKVDADGKIVYTNEAFNTLFHYAGIELRGNDYSVLEDANSIRFGECVKHLSEDGIWKGEVQLKTKYEKAVWVANTIVPFFNDDGVIYQYLIIGFDTTSRKISEQRIESMAYYDELTGLPNRRQFSEQLKRSIATCKRENKKFSILFLDLDDFKRINDSLGHDIGDKIIVAASKALANCIRESDYMAVAQENRKSVRSVSRFGGDEFTILLMNCIEPINVSKVVTRIIERFKKPFILDDRELTTTVSIGIAMYPDDGEDVSMLLKNADSAMFTAKKEQKGTYCFYTSSMNHASAKRLSLENDLRQALEKNQFVLHYQPKVDINTQKVVSNEALIRWEHTELGTVPPFEFIPLAEEINVIQDIGMWVLFSAAHQTVAWQDLGFPDLEVAVNLSVKQFSEKLPHQIEYVLKESKLAARHLELELTEGIIMENDKQTRRILDELKELGVKISVDDFGTGYSSLRYLSQFPLDYIKIDRSFITNLATNGSDQAITQAIVSLSHDLRLKVIAEGVETQEQIDYLKKYGCDYLQGFYISPPLPEFCLLDFLQGKKPSQSAAGNKKNI